MGERDVLAGASAAPSEPPKRRRRRGRLVLVAALLLLVVPLVAVAGYVGYLSHVVSSNIEHADLLPSAGRSTAAGQPGTTSGGSQTVSASGAVNYLLIGSDAGPDRQGARSDVIMLVHVPADRSGVTLVHFPRDMYVPIAGHGQDKINASFAYGGAPLLVQTVQDLTGVHVDHVALVGFEGFKAMTDAVGGVDVHVAQSSSRNGYTFTAGTTQHMDGDMALTFVRERYQLSEGDISRGQRQQAFLQALMVKVLSSDTLTNPVRLAGLVSAASSNVTVDQGLEVTDVEKLALSLRSVHGGDVRFITAPLTGFGTSPSGASIDLVDFGKLDALGHALARDDIASYRD